MSANSITAEKTTMWRKWTCHCGYAQDGVLSYYQWKKAWDLHKVMHWATPLQQQALELVKRGK